MCAAQIPRGLRPNWVMCGHYRTATLISGSLQLADIKAERNRSCRAMICFLSGQIEKSAEVLLAWDHRADLSRPMASAIEYMHAQIGPCARAIIKRLTPALQKG